MDNRYILTAFGKDRPGVVADVSRIIYEIGGNLEDSTMTRLMDEFAIILVFSVHERDVDEQLTMECRRLERDRAISAFFRQLETTAVHSTSSRPSHTLFIVGIDHTGIVYRVSKFLADLNINIINLSSEVSPSPESGSALYRMEIEVSVPETSSLDELFRGLEQLGEELQVEIQLQSI
jgi:glycine cleavage system transcriptional repressor